MPRQNEAVKRAMWNERQMMKTHQSSNSTARHKNDRKAHNDPGHNRINSSSFNFICLSVCYFASLTSFSFSICLSLSPSFPLYISSLNKTARVFVSVMLLQERSDETLFIVSFERFAHLHTVFFSLRIFNALHDFCVYL